MCEHVWPSALQRGRLGRRRVDVKSSKSPTSVLVSTSCFYPGTSSHRHQQIIVQAPDRSLSTGTKPAQFASDSRHESHHVSIKRRKPSRSGVGVSGPQYLALDLTRQFCLLIPAAIKAQRVMQTSTRRKSRRGPMKRPLNQFSSCGT